MPGLIRLLGLGLGLGLVAAASVVATPVRLAVDAQRSQATFQASGGGLFPNWFGRIGRCTGSVMFDRAGGSGTVDITVDMNAIDFGSDALNQWGRSERFFDVQRHPTAAFRGSFSGLAPGSEAELAGHLTIRGVTRPATLTVAAPACTTSRSPRRTTCRTEAWGRIFRDDYGIDAGKAFGLSMEVEFRIHITAIEPARD